MNRIPVLAIVLLSLVLLGPAAASAQDASPASSPVAGPCDAPALPPGTPTPMEASPEAPGEGPAGTPEAIEEAEETAEAAEAGTPVAAPEPVGTPADPDIAEEAVAALDNILACFNTGDFQGVAALVTTNWMLAEFGTTNPYDVVAAFESEPFASLSVESLIGVQSYDDGRVGVEFVLVFGNQLQAGRWFFVEHDGRLLLDEEQDLPTSPPADAETADVQMLDYAFELSQDSFVAGQPIAFNAVNAGEHPHELVIVRLPEGATFEQVMGDPALQEQVAFFGATFAEPGQSSTITLVNLEPGTYTLVCFVDVPEGVPHVARGMVAEFTVE